MDYQIYHPLKPRIDEIVYSVGNNGDVLTDSVTPIPFDKTEYINKDTVWSGSVFTPKRSAYYIIDGSVRCNSSIYTIELFKAGVVIASVFGDGGSTIKKFDYMGYFNAGVAYDFRAVGGNETVVNVFQAHYIKIFELR